MMKFNITNIFNTDKNTDLIVLIGTQTPEAQVIELLNKEPNVQVREAFTSKGVLQNLSGVQLVILGVCTQMLSNKWNPGRIRSA
ncbi:MAG: hypothetical protein WCK35_26390, partial [Chloroflexota bacterium]